MPVDALDDEEFARIFGPWRLNRAAAARNLFVGYPGRWWIAGGHAVDAFCGNSRDHRDFDLSIPRSDIGMFRKHMAGRSDLWCADQSVLRLLLPEDADNYAELPSTCENVWTRNDGGAPWDFDVILMSTVGTIWVYKRDSRISMPIDDILWTLDDVQYLRPEIQLLHKAKGLRPKDQLDFQRAAPMLDYRQRDWLRHALELSDPNHEWIKSLSTTASDP